MRDGDVGLRFGRSHDHSPNRTGVRESQIGNEVRIWTDVPAVVSERRARSVG